MPCNGAVNWLAYDKGDSNNDTVETLLDDIDTHRNTLSGFSAPGQVDQGLVADLTRHANECRSVQNQHDAKHVTDCAAHYDKVLLGRTRAGQAVQRAQAGDFNTPNTGANARLTLSIGAMNHGGGGK